MNHNEQKTIPKRPTIQAHCEDKTLLIPEQLNQFADAHIFMTDRQSCLYYKDLAADLRDIEFYTNQLCLTYVLEGTESFTAFDGQEIRLQAKDILLMPRNIYLVSDFQSHLGPLRSFLFFFSKDLVQEFLATTSQDVLAKDGVDGPLKIPASSSVSQYMEALRKVYKPNPRPSVILRVKLLELLYLLHEQDRKGLFRATLLKAQNQSQKRNIAHLMAEHALKPLSVEDYAALSGRSLSTFTREFRQLYGKSPKQWLIEARLDYARHLVLETSLTVTEIAFAIGYENVSHFIKTFRDSFGETPKKVRQNRPMDHF